MTRTRGRWCVVALLLMASVACGSDGAKRDNGAITKTGDLSVFDFRAGDCFTVPEEIKAELRQVTGVPCATPHTFEVFHVATYEGDTFPGEDKLDAFAQAACVDAFSTYVGIDYVDSSYFFTYLLPSVRSWDERKDQNVVCVITTAGKKLTKSVKGSKT